MIDGLKHAILGASVSTLVDFGLNGWTVAVVAHRAGCAKGLVNYHFNTKASVLEQSALAIESTRAERRVGAIRDATGAAALDALWKLLVDELKSGWLAAAFELRSRRGQGSNPATGDQTAIGQAFRAALAKSFGIDEERLPRPSCLLAALDGIGARLLAGDPRAEVEAAYNELWLGLIDLSLA